jgi:thymidylate synthase
MTVIEADSATELFTRTAQTVLRAGEQVRPRGLATTEVFGARLCLHQPRARLVTGLPGRLVNPAFAVAEATWILAGSDDPWIYEYNKKLLTYADGGVLRGAYGPRLRRWGGRLDQLAKVVETLRADPDSRRAVIQLYDPARDENGNKDVPCTLGFRFHLRNGKLVMSTTMRSQDVWLGLPYDVFTFTAIQELVAGWLAVEPGDYHHHVDSLHLYESDAGKVAQLSAGESAEPAELPALAIAWDELDETLAAVRDGQATGHAGWDTWSHTLRAYRLWRSGDTHESRAAAKEAGGVLCAALEDWFDMRANLRELRTGGAGSVTA